MKNTPKISVLMPAYNTEKYIAESIESILQQSFTDFELLITDDGSSDGTWAIIQEFSSRDVRVVAIKNECNSGISSTRNGLIRRSRGEFIVWQDADDISLPYRLERQYKFMVDHSDVGICGGALEFFNEEKKTSVRRYSEDDKSLRKNIFRYSPVAQPAAILRRDILFLTDLFDESLSQAEDLDLALRIGMLSKFANLKEVLVRYRQSSLSITSRKTKENIKQTLLVRNRARLRYGYAFSWIDRIVFIITLLIGYIFPSEVILWLFNLIRNAEYKNEKQI